MLQAIKYLSQSLLSVCGFGFVHPSRLQYDVSGICLIMFIHRMHIESAEGIKRYFNYKSPVLLTRIRSFFLAGDIFNDLATLLTNFRLAPMPAQMEKSMSAVVRTSLVLTQRDMSKGGASEIIQELSELPPPRSQPMGKPTLNPWSDVVCQLERLLASAL